MLVSITLIITLIMSLFFTYALRLYAIKNNLIDNPNHRSSHKNPTPRGGGMAIVLVVIFVNLFFYLAGLIDTDVVVAFLGSGTLIAAIGFLDDHKDISAKLRLIVHFTAAGWGIYWLGGIPNFPILEHSIILETITMFFCTLYLVWLLNLYNFMDGIDGIAGIETITVCAGALLLHSQSSAPQAWVAPATLLFATLGFLIWNFPPAKIFMGDAGSGFLGITLGLYSIHSLHIDISLFISWLILLGVFITDATITLLRRLSNRQKIFEAHRSHAYQYASRLFKSHKIVTLSVGAINIFWLLPIALLAIKNIYNPLILLFLAYFPLIILALYFKAGAKFQNI